MRSLLIIINQIPFKEYKHLIIKKLKEIGSDVEQGERKQKRFERDGVVEEVSNKLEGNGNKKIVPVSA